VTRHIVPILGSISLSKLSGQDIQRWVNKKSETLAPRTVRFMFAVLRSALKRAEKLGLIHRDPTRPVVLPRIQKYEARFLSRDDGLRLLASCESERLGPLFATTLALGLRIGEALGLKWEDLDLIQGSAAIRRTLHRTKQEGFVFGEPKSAAGRRVLSVPQFAVAVLKKHRIRQAEERLKAGGSWKNSGLVFTTPLGTPLDYSNVRREFQRMLRSAELPMMRLHDLRHTCASLLVAKGVHLKVVQQILGHSQISLTADTYTHVGQPLHLDAANQLNSVLTEEPIAPASTVAGVNEGVNSQDQFGSGSEDRQFIEEKVVSPEGIEPSTNRLRVCCSAN